MKVRARVRGIYSTAISKLLNDYGIELVDVTPQIAERIGVDPRRGLPADVTIKSDEDDPSQLLILGFPRAVEEVTEVLINSIPDLIIYKPKIGLYSCFKSRIIGINNNVCLAQTPIGNAVLVDEKNCTPGKELPVTVVKVPIKSGDRLVVSSKVRVVGKYAILGRGSGVSFSSFIRNKERISKLLEISADLIKEGYSIRWRSNADEADINNIIEELPELKKKFKEVEDSLKSSEPLKIVYVGEYMSILELTYRSKMYLDEVRSTVASTTPYHHVLRTLNRDENIVDLLDIIAKEVDPEKLLDWLRQWIANKILDRKEVFLQHKRVFKKNINIGRMQPREAEATPELLVKLRRTIKSKGIYDGLNVSKEIGDYAISVVREGEWHIQHEYFTRSGISKGMYFNINTPPEILPNGTIRYVDLEVDLVKVAGSGCKLIDSEGFRKLIAEQSITQEIIENVIREIESLISAYCSLTK
jgi:hypothetical protein